MNNKTIAVFLNDTFLIKIIEDLASNNQEIVDLNIIDELSDLPKYSLIVTDIVTLKKIEGTLNKSQTILCIGEEDLFPRLNNINCDVSFLKVPFKFSELKQRAENIFSTLNAKKNTTKEFRHFSYNNKNRLLKRNKKNLIITEKENEIFNYLINNSKIYTTKEKLLNEIWNYKQNIDTHTLETHMYSLRKKIDTKLDLRNLIVYVEKKGYVINKDFL